MKRNLAVFVTVMLILWNGCNKDGTTQTQTPPVGNNPPAAPSSPSPADNATGVTTAPTLSWTCSDPEGDSLTYSVYLGFRPTALFQVSSAQQATSVSVSGLIGDTTYYWEVFVRDNRGNALYGPTWSFRTLITVPTVTTGSITGITSYSATGGGQVTAQGTATVTARGVCWNTTGNPTISDTKTIDGSGTGNFTSLITGLGSSRLYYVRAYATNSTGTSYGTQTNFITEVWSSCPGIPTVVYAGRTYNTVQIGNQCWLRENLDVGTIVSGFGPQTDNGIIEKYCYGDVSTNCNPYGALYQWDEAMQYVTTGGAQGICPPGWHLPTLAEFQTLSSTVGGSGNALKREDQGIGIGDGTNTSGFSGLLAGLRDNGAFFSLGIAGVIWGSTEASASNGHRLSLSNATPDIDLGNSTKSRGNSVRCLKN